METFTVNIKTKEVTMTTEIQARSFSELMDILRESGVHDGEYDTINRGQSSGFPPKVLQEAADLLRKSNQRFHG